MRLRAIREYTAHHICNAKPPHKTTIYNVTFAEEDGVVVSDANFFRQEEADFIVDAVNKRFDELGPPGQHCSTWLEDEND